MLECLDLLPHLSTVVSIVLCRLSNVCCLETSHAKITTLNSHATCASVNCLTSSSVQPLETGVPHGRPLGRYFSACMLHLSPELSMLTE